MMHQPQWRDWQVMFAQRLVDLVHRFECRGHRVSDLDFHRYCARQQRRKCFWFCHREELHVAERTVETVTVEANRCRSFRDRNFQIRSDDVLRAGWSANSF